MERDSLTDDLRKSGKTVTLRGNQTIYWDDPQSIWFLLKGEINLFVVPYEEGAVTGKRDYLFTVEEGQIIVGVDKVENLSFRLLMNAVAETEIVQIDVASFTELASKKRELQLL